MTNCTDTRPLLSLVHDGEAELTDRAVEHLERCPSCRAELASHRRLSELLVVSAQEPDPSFVARFRLRREDLRRSAAAWRWLAVRLVPLSAAAAAAAVITVLFGAGTSGELGDLETHALRSGVTAVTYETVVADRVLGLDLESARPTE